MKEAPLGKPTAYLTDYQPNLLHPIPRQFNRATLGIDAKTPPFYGEDVWHAYELSWLNAKGKPQNAIARFTVPCDSPNLIESKSLKLYLNSLNGTRFPAWESVDETLIHDLSHAAGKSVKVEIFTIDSFMGEAYYQITGECLDDLDIAIDAYHVEPNLLSCQKDIVEETLYSNLLKTNCLVTGQPDWASVVIRYHGPRLNRKNLLKYLISYRNHQAFHEQCVERIFTDLQSACQPKKLTVTACFTRRGGLDINPVRSTNAKTHYDFARCPRQ